jgi:hypothetical protein
MGFDPELEGGFGEVGDANRRIVQFWGPGFSLDGKPDFERVFGSQFVESKGGGKAQNSKRDPLRDFEESLIGGDWGFFCAVQTATHTLDFPALARFQRCERDMERPLSSFERTRVRFWRGPRHVPLSSSHARSIKTSTLVNMCIGFARDLSNAKSKFRVQIWVQTSVRPKYGKLR